MKEQEVSKLIQSFNKVINIFCWLTEYEVSYSRYYNEAKDEFVWYIDFYNSPLYTSFSTKIEANSTWELWNFRYDIMKAFEDRKNENKFN